MIARIVSSLVILPLFIFLIFLQDPRLYLLLCAAFLVIGFLEFRGIMGLKGMHVPLSLGVAGILLWCVADLPAGLPVPLDLCAGLVRSSWLLPATVVAFLLSEVLRYREKTSVPSLCSGLFAMVYLGALGSCILRLRVLPHGAWWSFLIFFFSWTYDAGAYFVGKAIGKTPLSSVSPRKTMEGFAGGIVLSLALSLLVLSRFLPADFPLQGLALGAVSLAASLLAQGGDLAESMFKRYAGVKDSGRFIRFGGILDKIDSPLFVGGLLFVLATS